MKPLTKTLTLGFGWVILAALLASAAVEGLWQYLLLLGSLPGMVFWLLTDSLSIISLSICALLSVSIIMLPYIIFKLKGIQSNWYYVASSAYSLLNTFLGFMYIAAQHV